MKIVGVVLAAGEGRRIGVPKALLTYGGRSFLAHALSLLARPGIARVFAVIGHEAERVRAEAGAASGDLVLNGGYRDGMLASVLAGLARAEAEGAEAVVLHPVDHPLVAAETIDRVVEALGAGARIAVPSFEGRRGHPVGFARAAWPALRAAPPAEGARAVLARYPDWVVHVPGDPGSLRGVNTREEYERLTRI